MSENENQPVESQQTDFVADKTLKAASDIIEEISVRNEAAHLALVLNFEKVAPNSVLVVKIPADNPVYLNRLQRAIVDGVIGPRIDLLKEKKLGVLFMTTQDSIEVLTEEDMNKAGWYRREQPDKI